MCGEGIRNPVCPECLAEEIESWLVDYRQDLIEKFRTMNLSISSYMHTGVFCTICNLEMAICQKCYFKEVSTLVSGERDLVEGTFAESLVLGQKA
jgi:hypothetical protein